MTNYNIRILSPAISLTFGKRFVATILFAIVALVAINAMADGRQDITLSKTQEGGKNWSTSGYWNPDTPPTNSTYNNYIVGNGYMLRTPTTNCSFPSGNTAQGGNVLYLGYSNTSTFANGSLNLKCNTVTVDNLQLGNGSLCQGLEKETITLNGNVAVNGSGTFDSTANQANDSRQLNVASTITGNGTLTLQATTTYTGIPSIKISSSDNPFTGSVVINASSIYLAGSNALANAKDVTVNNGCTIYVDANNKLCNLASSSNPTLSLGTNVTLTLDNSTSTTYKGTITGSGKITKTGTGELILTQRNSTYSGNTSIEAGTVTVKGSNSATSIFGTGKVVIKAGATLDASQTWNVFGWNANNDVEIAGTFKPHSLTHVKNVTLTGGTIEADTGDTGVHDRTGLDFANRAGTITSTGTSYIKSYMQTNGTLDIDVTDTLTLSNNIIGSGKITKKGTGDLILTSHLTHSGEFVIEAGTVYAKAGNAQSSSFGTGKITIESGATLDTTYDWNAFGYGTDSPNDLKISGTLKPNVLTHVKNITMAGGTIDEDVGDPGIFSRTGLDFGSRTGTLTSSGTSKIKSYMNVGNTLAVEVNNTLQNSKVIPGILTDSNVITGSGKITKSGTGTLVLKANVSPNIELSSGTLEFSPASDTSMTVSGVISGSAGTLTKSGDGELVLTQRNSYSGNFNVTAGTLTLQAAGDNNNPGTLYKGTTLTASGSETVVQAAGIDALGYFSNAVGTINLKNGATLKNTSTTNHITLSSVVNLESGNILATGDGNSNYGAFVFDNQINVKSIKSTDNQSSTESSESTTSVSESTISGGTISFRTGNHGGITCIGGQIDVATNAKLTISSVVKNNKDSNSSITKTGAGELVLDAYNTYTGDTTVNGGTLTLKQVGESGTLASGSTVTVDGSTAVLQGHGDILGYNKTTVGTLNLNNGGKLKNDATDEEAIHITVGATINMNNGVIEATGTGHKDVGNFIFDAPINVKGGTTNEINAKGGIYFRKFHQTPGDGGGLITVAKDAVLTINSNIIASDYQVLTKKGDGTLVLSKKNDYTKGTKIEAGILKLTEDGTLGSGTVTLNGGTLEIDKDYTLSTLANNWNGSLTIDSGTTTISGSTTQVSGTTTIAQNAELSIGGGILNNLTGAGTLTTSNDLTLNVDSGKSTSFSGTISASDKAVTKTGNGTLALSGSKYNITKTTISAGTLEMTDKVSLNEVAINGGTLQLDGDENTIKTLNSSNTGSKLLSDNSITIKETSSFYGSVNPITSGKVPTITVDSGSNIVKLNSPSDSNKSTGNFIVDSGRLDLKGYYIGSLEVQNGSTFSPGNSVGTVDLTGNALLKTGSTLLLEIAGTSAEQNDRIIVNNGKLTVEDGAIINLVLAEDSALAPNAKFEVTIDAEFADGSQENFKNGLTSYYFINLNLESDPITGNWKITGTLDPNAVPEPSTWALLILGFAGLMKVANCELRVAKKRERR